MDHHIIDVINKNTNETTFILKNFIEEDLYCNAYIDENQKIKELLIWNKKNNSYESIINLYSEGILSKIESAIKN